MHDNSEGVLRIAFTVHGLLAPSFLNEKKGNLYVVPYGEKNIPMVGC